MPPIKTNKKSRASAPVTVQTLKGKVSWFGGPNDSETGTKNTALGLSTDVPGIAVYDQGTLGGYWKVTTENGRSKVIRQTDIGPAPYTGRVVDITYSALASFGYTEGDFPTDSVVTAVYLGKDRQAAELKGGQSPVDRVNSEVTGTPQNVDLLGEVGKVVGEGFSIAKDLAEGNYEDLGAKFALVSLQLAKDLAVGVVDLIVGPAWHWNQRSVSWYSKIVLDPTKYGDGSDDQWAFIWTAAFWGLGYVLLYTDPDSKSLKPAPPHRSRFTKHARRLQSIPARRTLIKPKDVREKTPSKPKPVVSSAALTPVDTMSTERSRTVRVKSNGSDRPNSSQVPVQRVEVKGDGTISRVGRPVQSHKTNNAGKGAPKGGRDNTKGPTKASRSKRRHN